MAEFLSDNENSLNVCDDTFFHSDDPYPEPRDETLIINEDEIPQISVEGKRIKNPLKFLSLNESLMCRFLWV